MQAMVIRWTKHKARLLQTEYSTHSFFYIYVLRLGIENQFQLKTDSKIQIPKELFSKFSFEI